MSRPKPKARAEHIVSPAAGTANGTEGRRPAAIQLVHSTEPAARPDSLAEVEGIGAEQRPDPKYYLEAMIIGGIVAASYLIAANQFFG